MVPVQQRAHPYLTEVEIASSASKSLPGNRAAMTQAYETNPETPGWKLVDLESVAFPFLADVADFLASAPNF